MSLNDVNSGNKNLLRRKYVGSNITDLPAPAMILDRSKMRRHCQSLLEAVEFLGVDFRGHVKSHKTREGVRLQVGHSSKDVRLIASTVYEIEFLQPVLQEFIGAGRQVNMLYGMPLSSSHIDRLAIAARDLGPGTISVLVDHASQLKNLALFFEKAGFAAGVYLKVDTGYHRAGLPPAGINKDGLVAKLLDLEERGIIHLIGLYSHSSLSYYDSAPDQAMANLETEIQGCLQALDKNTSLFSKDKEITISVGASPQVTAVENLVSPQDGSSEDAKHLRDIMQKVMTQRPNGFRTKLELHAGVYTVLDIQQLSTHSRANFGDYEDEIAISVVAEVYSVYNDNERQQPEALLAAGVLALGREPCVAYEGWGVIHRGDYPPDESKPERRLIVSRISQELCIVSWDKTEGQDDTLPLIPLEVGQKVRIIPNHACIALAMYPWYFVVDSSEDEKRVVDVWERASRW